MRRHPLHLRRLRRLHPASAAARNRHRRDGRHGQRAEWSQGRHPRRRADHRHAILIELVTAGTPALPAGYTSKGQVFAFTPHGTTFAQPVTVTIPFDPAVVIAARAPGFYKTNAQNQWEKIPNAVFDASSVSAPVTSFRSWT